MRLLLTRPAVDAGIFAQAMAGLGHDAVIAPLMEVRLQSGPPIALDGVQAVLATSANGIRGLAERTVRRDVTIYAVGPQTAEAATAAGFARVHNASGDASALVELVAAEADPKGGTLLHAAGKETAGRVRQALQAHGFTVETLVLYDAQAVTQLPAAAALGLREAALDGVLLFSPRSAKVFASLVAAAKLAPACAKLTAYCISAATAAALTSLTFARVAVAGTPNQEAMLALLSPASNPPSKG
jgi:uroporphyrinogen-III synthase